MGLKDDYDFSLIQNEAEHLVIAEMEAQLPESDFCRCEDCVLDIGGIPHAQMVKMI